jgi:hypothetical protein
MTSIALNIRMKSLKMFERKRFVSPNVRADIKKSEIARSRSQQDVRIYDLARPFKGAVFPAEPESGLN